MICGLWRWPSSYRPPLISSRHSLSHIHYGVDRMRSLHLCSVWQRCHWKIRSSSIWSLIRHFSRYIMQSGNNNMRAIRNRIRAASWTSTAKTENEYPFMDVNVFMALSNCMDWIMLMGHKWLVHVVRILFSIYYHIWYNIMANEYWTIIASFSKISHCESRIS